jgi:hypothetical protein
MTEKWIKLATSLVLQVFWDDNASVVKNVVFLGGSVCQHRLTAAELMFKNSLTPKPFTLSGRVNNCWKEERVLYNYCIGLQVRFQACQRQN